MLALRAMPVATGMMHTVLSATALALIEAVSIMSGSAVLYGADGFVVREWQIGIALKVLWCKGLEDIADGGHEVSPRINALMRV